MIKKWNRPKKIWLDKRTEFAGAFKKFCAAEGIQFYSNMSETKAVFAERTIRSLQNILYRYMEDYGFKYIHRVPQFITTLNCRRNSSIDMRPNTVKKCDLMSIPYSKLLREYRKPTFKLVIELESQSMNCFLAKVTSWYYTRSFWNCSNCNKETTNIHNQGWARGDYLRQILSKRAD